MEDTNNMSYFIKADDNKVINQKEIMWIKKMTDCLEVCIKKNGCEVGKNTHKICKINSLDSYNKLNVLFN